MAPSTSHQDGAPPLIIRMLGGFSVMAEGEPVTTLSAPRVRALLAFLLLHRGVAQPRPYVAFQFWPDSSEEQALTNLRKHFLLLRRALPQAEPYLEVTRAALRWRDDPPPVSDVERLEAAIATTRAAEQAGDSQRYQAALERGVALYAGELLPDCYEEWLLPHRERLHLCHLGLLERFVALLEAEGRYSEAIAQMERLLQADPLREARHRELMRLHLRNGDHARAAQVYQEVEAALRRDLGVAPSAATRALYDSLVNGKEAALLTPDTISGHHTAQRATLAALPLIAREIIELAAVVGRPFSLPLLLAASDHAEGALVRALDTLWQQGHLVEEGPIHYALSPPALGTLAYGEMSRVKRRWMHRRIAGALERVHRRDLAAVQDQIARHQELGRIPYRSLNEDEGTEAGTNEP